MAADDGVNFSVGADTGPMIASMKKAEESIRTSAAQMKTSIESIGSGLAKIQTAFLAFAAVAAGGEAMKRIVQSAGAWQLESVKLSKALGITTEQASIYMVALQRLGISTDVMYSAASKMSKQIYAHAEDFKRLGVTLKDTHGNYRPLADVMEDVNAKLVAIKNPIAQNIAGQKMYGKGWEEIRGILKLNAEQHAIAAQRAKELGLIVSGESTQAAKEYKAALADMDLVGKSLTMQLGNALLPVMTSIGTVFANAAPQVGETFGNALKLVASFAIDVGAAMTALGTHIGGMFAAAAAALHGDFSGAGQILRDMSADVDAIEKKAEEMKAKLYAPPAKSGDVDLSGGDPNAKSDGAGSRVSEWETQLAERKAAFEAEARAAGSFREFDKSQELAYWQRILATAAGTLEEKRSVRRKVADAEAAISKERFEAELADLKTQEAETGKNADAKLAIAQTYAAKVKVAYGEDSKQYQEASRQVVEIERQKQEQLRQIRDIYAATARNAELAKVDAAEQDARLEVELGRKTNAELIAQQRQFEDERFQIRQEVLEKQKAQIDPNRDPVEYAKINAEIEALELEHQTKMGELQRQATVASNANYMTFFKGLQSGFANVISGFLKGTQTFGQTIKGLFASVLDMIVQMIAQMIAKWIAAKIMQLAFGKAAAQGEVQTQAAIAGAAGVASFAGAPWPVDMGAPGFGAQMYAAASAFGAVASAAGGFDIPAGMNPVTQLHGSEMVLPAHIAEPLRESLAGGGGMGGDTHFHVHALDSKDLEKYLKANARALAPAIRALHRNFTPVIG